MKIFKGKNLKTLKRIITALLSAAVVLMAAAVAYLTYCNISGKVAYIGRHAAVKIITSSMEPTIPAGTYILAEKVQPESVSVGDVIMFYSRDPQIYGRINTHRVVEVVSDNGELSYITRGDNNPANDSYPVYGKDLIGRYVKNADRLTAFAGFFSNPVVFFILVIIPAAVLVIVCMLDVVKKAKEARMKMLVEDEIKRLQENETNAKEQKPDV
ncbi:MAG: signal peptidase I [Acutalibacteraceae bacterium]